MVQALGFSHTEFNPIRPGRLCRGRERWIEPWPSEEEAPPPEPIHRLVISGATFTDDSARDALRGVVHSKIDIAQIVSALFPRRRLLAFMEDGHPADIPELAEGIEAYEGYRAGGHTEVGLVRWHLILSGIREIRAVLGDATQEQVRGFAQLEDDTDVEELSEVLFQLVGMSTLDSPPARYQPAALPEVLKRVKAVILLHRDKHGPALGIYSRAPIRTEGRLETLCTKAESVLVPFAIPPMLARWDRALSELRSTWSVEERGEFPVPPSPEPAPSSWEGGRRRRRGKSGGEPKTAPQGERSPEGESQVVKEQASAEE